MARLAKRSTPDDSENEQPVRRATAAQHRRSTTGLLSAGTESRAASTSPTSTSFLSDKENRATASRNAVGKKKMSPLGQSSSRNEIQGANKRRRVGERDSSRAASVISINSQDEEDVTDDFGGHTHMTKAEKRKALNDITDTRFYDPEQDQAERRNYRMKVVELSRTVADNKQDYLQRDSRGLFDTIRSANKLYGGYVKQTADAALDARLLVTTGDLAAKKSIQNKLGAAETGIDLDEFVAKCAAFMQRGPKESEIALAPQASQRRRTVRDGSDSENERRDESEELNWPWLGLRGAFPANIRPPVPGFLLGPLSVKKKVRNVTQRRARQEKRNPADAKRPDELEPDQIEKQENANLTGLVRKTFWTLQRFIGQAQIDLEKEINKMVDRRGYEATEDEINAVAFQKHITITDSGVVGACLFNFAFNPKSFGQTVENLFYISFLIRDGKLGIEGDRHGLMTLVLDPADTVANEDNMSPQELEQKRKEDEKRARNAKKWQSVFHLDFEMWQDICEAFEISACAIPHREEDGGKELGEKGWYA